MAESNNKSGVSEQILSLPKGGGAIKGMGEKFQPDLHTGTGNYSIPLSLPPGRNDFTPSLALAYSTGAGNGPFGLGFSMGFSHISRKTSKGIPMFNDEKDTFILSGAEDLVEVHRETIDDIHTVRYCPRTEGLFARIEHRVDSVNQKDWWEVTSKNGVKSIYGDSPDSQVFVEKNGIKKIFAWYLVSSTDKLGNKILYHYKLDNGPVPIESPHEYNQTYLESIEYDNYVDPATNTEKYLLRVDFDFGEFDHTEQNTQEWKLRPDPFSSYRSGFEIRTTRRCERILLRSMHPDVNAPTHLIRSFDFYYTQDPLSGVSLLKQVVHRGYSMEQPGAEARDWDFETQTAVTARQHKNTNLFVSSFPPVFLDYTTFNPMARQIETLTFGCDHPPEKSIENPNYEIIDLFGNGLPDILRTTPTGHYCWRNLGKGQFAGPRKLKQAPAGVTLADDGVQFADMNGNGSADLLITEGTARGFYENDFSGRWKRFHPFVQSPSFSLRDPNVRLVDLNGDGVVDVLATLEHHFLYIKNKGGTHLEFEDPVPIPRRHNLEEWPDLFFAHPEKRVRLADMSGDGLQDMVLIHDGRVDYWPNLGHGRWGKRITLLNGPRLPGRFDPKRIFLADINGDGLADLVYVASGSVHFWINRSGNAWSDEQVITCAPPVTDVDSIRIADMKGTGTGGILWSFNWNPTSRNNYHYLDFTGGEKPMLLNKIDNRLGATIHVQYHASTDFYVEDAASGNPWKTSLPFPVNVVSRVTAKDEITGNVLTSLFKYRHGFYQGKEREFCGFGCTHQTDTEKLVGLEGAVPPVLTKSWFHTGAYFEEKEHLDIFRQEYFSQDNNAFMAHSNLETGDAPAEAYRALRGAILRTEVYALDDSDKVPYPYTVTENGYWIRLLQAKGDKAHAVFHRNPLETISYHYERNPEDPRIGHTLFHDIDAYGNVKKSLEVAYPRRTPIDQDPHPEEQTLHHLVLNENEFINQDDPAMPYFIGVPYEAKKTELKLENLPQVPLRPEDVNDLIQTSNPNLFSHVRNYYDGDPYTGLPLGEIGEQGLLTRSETLALKPQQREVIYDNRVDSADMLSAGYAESPDGSDAWWVQTQRNQYADAPNRFFQQIGQRDPIGHETTIEYDDFQLLPIKTIAPLDTVIEVKNDYQIFAPYHLIDPNKNRSQIKFNAFGMVLAIAVMGKEGENKGDSLEGFSEHAAGDPVANPHDFLQKASSRLIADLFYFELNELPVFFHTITRETHHADPGPNNTTRIQQNLTYSDGFGREVQTKAQAELGDVDGVPTDTRWVGSGWKIYNNKGWVVEQYEPFFSGSHQYEGEVLNGVSAKMTYDPLGRVIRTDTPNGTFSRVEFDPWLQTTWDQNDIVADSTWYQEKSAPNATLADQDAAAKAYEHRNTPSKAYLDTLGRTFLAVEDNGTFGLYETRSSYDIQGNVLEIHDPRHNKAFSHTYDLLKNNLHRWQMDSGDQFNLLNAAGNPIKAWKCSDYIITTEYDELNRPTHLRVKDLNSGDERLAEKTVYGESRPNPELKNLRGKIYEQRDGAGIETVEEYDFKGNIIKTKRRILENYREHVDWNQNPSLLQEIYESSMTYDALNRIASSTILDSGTMVGSTIPVYNEAGLLESVKSAARSVAMPTEIVRNIDYNAKGQREKIEYGNGAVTDYIYDPDTFRLVRLTTTRPGVDNKIIQDYHYTFDPTGNITRLEDGASQRVFFDNTVVDPIRTFKYDPMYRLIKAIGREHSGQSSSLSRSDPPRIQNIPHANEPNALRNYTQTYKYDPAGNIKEMKHAYNNTIRRREYDYQDHTNRMIETRVGQTSVQYGYDECGNITAMGGHLPEMKWDFEDQLIEVDLNGGGRAYYRYDTGGQRTRKVVIYQNGNIKEYIYLGDYEIFREYSSEANLLNRNVKTCRGTLHIMDDQQHVAMIETLTVNNHVDISNNPQQRIRYQLNDHLGSSAVELSIDAQVISFEEYYPYGGTSYHSTKATSEVSDKRYRYNGKEKDEETGLYYFGARYYACWLGRWLSCDPIGSADEINLYVYVADAPISFIDKMGTQKTAGELAYMEPQHEAGIAWSEGEYLEAGGFILLATLGLIPYIIERPAVALSDLTAETENVIGPENLDAFDVAIMQSGTPPIMAVGMMSKSVRMFGRLSRFSRRAGRGSKSLARTERLNRAISRAERKGEVAKKSLAASLRLRGKIKQRKQIGKFKRYIESDSDLRKFDSCAKVAKKAEKMIPGGKIQHSDLLKSGHHWYELPGGGAADPTLLSNLAEWRAPNNILKSIDPKKIIFTKQEHERLIKYIPDTKFKQGEPPYEWD